MFSPHWLARSHAARHWRAGAVFIIAALIGCNRDEATGPTVSGKYVATTFTVVPTFGGVPLPAIDILAAGGSLSVVIATDLTITGTMNIPGSITGGAPLIESMAGTAEQTGNTIQFQQTADTFVRKLTWQFGTDSITVVNQPANNALLTITLKRQ